MKLSSKVYIQLIAAGLLVLLFQNCGGANHSGGIESASGSETNAAPFVTADKLVSEADSEGLLHWDLSSELSFGTPLEGAHLTLTITVEKSEVDGDSITFSNPTLYAGDSDIIVREVSIWYNGSEQSSSVDFSTVDFTVKKNTAQYLTAKTMTIQPSGGVNDGDKISISFSTLSDAPAVEPPSDETLTLGRNLYQQYCLACHAQIDSNNINSSKYSIESVKNAFQSVQPMSFLQGQLDDNQINAIVEALKAEGP